eukprot:752352-Hanusia_phi.AAC.1
MSTCCDSSCVITAYVEQLTGFLAPPARHAPSPVSALIVHTCDTSLKSPSSATVVTFDEVARREDKSSMRKTHEVPQGYYALKYRMFLYLSFLNIVVDSIHFNYRPTNIFVTSYNMKVQELISFSPHVSKFIINAVFSSTYLSLASPLRPPSPLPAPSGAPYPFSA